MIIIGHNLVKFKPFYKIKNSDEELKTSPNLTVVFEFKNKELIEFCQKNNIKFAIETQILKEALLANAAGASYIIAQTKKAAKNIQNLAE